MPNGISAHAEGDPSDCASFLSLVAKADEFHQTIIKAKPAISIPEKSDGSAAKFPRTPRPESRINLHHRHSYSDADDVQIAMLYNSGHNDKQIAAALGVSVSAVAQRIFKMRKSGKLQERPPVKDSQRGKRRGPRKSKPDKPSEVEFSDAQIKLLRELNRDKLSISDIAAKLGKNSIEVMAVMKNLGIVAA